MDEKCRFLSLHASYLPIQVLKTSLTFPPFLQHATLKSETIKKYTPILKLAMVKRLQVNKKIPKKFVKKDLKKFIKKNRQKNRQKI